MARVRGRQSEKVRLRGLFERYVLSRIWYVHSPVILMIGAPPAMILKRIKTAARPSTKRLDQRNLYVQGRRYHFRPQVGGFRLTTTSKVRWRYRKRTSSTSVLMAVYNVAGHNLTRLELKVRINLGYLLDTFLIPVFIASIVYYVPWPQPVIVVSIMSVFGLSWLGHRFNASFEANEMIWFIQKVLEDLQPDEYVVLEATTDHTIHYNRDFEVEWQRFYDEHKGQK